MSAVATAVTLSPSIAGAGLPPSDERLEILFRDLAAKSAEIWNLNTLANELSDRQNAGCPGPECADLRCGKISEHEFITRCAEVGVDYDRVVKALENLRAGDSREIDETDAKREAALDGAYGIADEIGQTPARTITGVIIKAKTVAWLRTNRFDSFDWDSDLTETTDLRICGSLLADLAAIGAD